MEDDFGSVFFPTLLIFIAFIVGAVKDDDEIYYPTNKILIPTDTLVINNDTTFIYEVDRSILVDEVIIKSE